MRILESKAGQWAVLSFLAFIWGSSFILMKRSLVTYTANEVAAARIVISFIVLTPFMFKHLNVLKSKSLVPLIMVGIFGNCIPAFLFTQAQLGMDSSIIGILNSLVPLFTLILGFLFFKSKVPMINVIGVILGLTGAVGLIALSLDSTTDSNYVYSIYVIIAAFCYAMSVNLIKRYLHEMDSFAITAVAFLFVGPPCAIYLFGNTEFVQTTLTVNGAYLSLFYIAILAIVGTATAVVLFNMLIKQTTAIFATSVTYLIPIVAVFWGLLDDEPFSIYHFIWLCIILGGVYLVNKRK